MSTNWCMGLIWKPLARWKSCLTCVTWLPVSSRAVTGCPLMKILSSLAYLLILSKSLHVSNLPVLPMTLPSSPHGRFCSNAGLLRWGMPSQSIRALYAFPLGTTLCLLEWGNHILNAPPLHISNTCVPWKPPALAGGFWLLAGEWLGIWSAQADSFL